MTKRYALFLLPCLLICLAGCPQQEAARTSPAAAPHVPTGNQTTPAVPQQMQAPKQLVLIYSGSTNAQIYPSGTAEFDNLTGGLPALAAEIAAVEQEIVHYNRLRVANEGGDPSLVRVDLDAGMIGDHPFMLLDYGGWYAPDVQEDLASTALMLEAMQQQRYTAVAFRDWPLFAADELELLGTIEQLPLLVNSSVAMPQQPQGVERVVLREVLGTTWGIVSLPRLPETDRAKYDDMIRLELDACAAELEHGGAQFSILLAADQTSTVYRELADDERFSVVIGAPGAMSAMEGFDDYPAQGPVFLPHLSDGGTELARCHLIWDEESSGPVHVFFERREVKDSGEEHLPWRKRINEMKARP